MSSVLLAMLALVVAIVSPVFFPKGEKRLLANMVRIIAAGAALFLILSTSYVIIDADKVGHLKRIYGGKPMGPGQIIALDGEKGPQARILSPGFKFQLLPAYGSSLCRQDGII
ncbi:MAG: hypothetical protein DRI57_27685 [Deltaproteobacteria bacterium]|nr:MAG: hypothetical protein DRI57_27685 [Deltaproteobacteria bacterium]